MPRQMRLILGYDGNSTAGESDETMTETGPYQAAALPVHWHCLVAYLQVQQLRGRMNASGRDCVLFPSTMAEM